MSQPISFSVDCFEWGATTSLLAPSATPPRGGFLRRLPEKLKPLARCVYMLVISTFFAPLGIFYHLFAAPLKLLRSSLATSDLEAARLSEHAWLHLRKAGEDYLTFNHGFVFLAFSVGVLWMSTMAIAEGLRSNNLVKTMLAIGGLWFGLYVAGQSLIPLAWNRLEDIDAKFLSKDDGSQAFFEIFIPTLIFLLAFYEPTPR